ncbi:MAG: methionine--tRNA ligase [Nanoarchaeota archaeon]
MKKFYITTAIDYVNADPHQGHAYEKIIADAIARWHRLCGEDVFFLTGTDDNASKNEEAAIKAGVPTKEFVDKNAKKFEQLCKLLNISHNYFIRTTSSEHFKVAQEIFKRVYDNGDIYKGKYKGLYCKGCEAFYTEKDLVKSKCPEHPNREIEILEEESYFFKLSKYHKKILELIQKGSFIEPQEWKNEILSRLASEKLEDLSVSRVNKKWGIPTPIDKKHFIYVWFDALLNYYTATRLKGKEKYWPADIHLIGKGINWFHSVIFPAILLSAGIDLPKKILVHGYLTVEGQKIGKSVGNVTDPIWLVKKYGADSLRYFLLREIPFGEDGDFSEKALIERHNNELANELGNLVSRSLSMVEKYFDGKVPKGKNVLKLETKPVFDAVEKYELHVALQEIWKLIAKVNKYINDSRPWNAENKEEIIYSTLDSIRQISILVYPFIPETADNINKQLGIKLGNFKDLKNNLLKPGGKVNKRGILFTKIQ